MPHRGWRIGSGGAESAPADRLTPDRLAGFLSFLRSVSPESSDELESVEASEQPQATGSAASAAARDEKPEGSVAGAKRQVAEPRAADSSPVGRPPGTVPTLAATSVARVADPPADVEPAEVVPPPGVAPADVVPTVVGPPEAAPEETVPAVVEPVVVDPAVVTSAVVAPAAVDRDRARPTGSKKGRHRPPGSGRFGIRGIAFSGRRLALLGALTVAVIAAVVLALM